MGGGRKLGKGESKPSQFLGAALAGRAEASLGPETFHVPGAGGGALLAPLHSIPMDPSPRTSHFLEGGLCPSQFLLLRGAGGALMNQARFAGTTSFP